MRGAKKRSKGHLVLELDALWHELAKDSTPAQRALSWNLFQAALSVAVHGSDQVPREFAKRAAHWSAANSKRVADAAKKKKDEWAVDAALARTRRPKNRVPKDGDDSAFEKIGKKLKMSSSAVEKIAYRKSRD